jgi:hypothetical protein
MIKDELQIILNGVKAIPKSENKETELDNIYPFVLKLKELKRRCELEGKEKSKEFKDTFLETDLKLSERIWMVIEMVQQNESIRKENVDTLTDFDLNVMDAQQELIRSF